MRRLVACCFATVLLAPTTGAKQVAASNVEPRAHRTVSGLPLVLPGSPDLAVLDRLVFATPLAQFRSERSKAKRLHRWLITSTDGCTAPLVGSSGRSFDFRVACERHEIGRAHV